MEIKYIDAFEEDLIKMMTNFWAIENNGVCAKETLNFMNKYKIDDEENEGIRQGLRFTINNEEES